MSGESLKQLVQTNRLQSVEIFPKLRKRLSHGGATATIIY